MNRRRREGSEAVLLEKDVLDWKRRFDSSGGTFMGLDSPDYLAQHEVAILGIPLDMGTRQARIGSREGPNAIRAASRMLGMRFGYLVERPGLTPFDPPIVADWGNVKVALGQIGSTYELIRDALAPVKDSGLIPVAMGGDGSVTLPQLRIAHEMYGDIAVLHLDAHTDAVSGTKENPYTNATGFFRAQEEGLVTADDVIHVGVRGTCPVPDTVEIARDLGQQVITGEDLRSQGLDGVADQLLAKLANRNVFLSWDMDVFDPSAAPGVVTPEWGGISSGEGIAFIRRLAPLDLKWFDINTVSPPHDINFQTSSLAARMILEFLYLASRRRQSS